MRDGSSGCGNGVAASGCGLSPNIEQAAVSTAADTTTIAVAGLWGSENFSWRPSPELPRTVGET